MPRQYAPFWLAGGTPTDAEWAERDAQVPPEHPAEALTMREWFELTEAERCAVVEQYSGSRPRRRILFEERERERRVAAGLFVRRRPLAVEDA